MKKLICNTAFFGLILFMVCQVSAQTQTPGPQQTAPRKLNNAQMASRLQQDLAKRNPAVPVKSTDWWDTGNGYFGTYSANNNNYMVRYNLEGKYVETLEKRDWRSNPPANLKTAFQKSRYKDQQVEKYWAVVDPERETYLFELKNQDGLMSRVWVDEAGHFSDIPPYGDVSQTIQKKEVRKDTIK